MPGEPARTAGPAIYGGGGTARGTMRPTSPDPAATLHPGRVADVRFV